MMETDERRVNNPKMVNAQEFGARLKALRLELGMTLQEVGDAMGVKQQSVSGWEDGSVPRPYRWERLARVLRTSVAELFYGKPSSETPNSRNAQILTVDFRGRVPLIGWAQTGNWLEEHSRFHPGDAEKWLHVTVETGQMAFALRVIGDSMEPKVPAGSVVVIDPDKALAHGAIVLAKLDDTYILRQYWLDGQTPYLRPLNDRYPILPAFDAKVVGVAHQAITDLSV